MVEEPGAVMCRVSKSFLRVSQLELFAKRGETSELIQLADYLCYREFPYLLEGEKYCYPSTTMSPENVGEPFASGKNVANGVAPSQSSSVGVADASGYNVDYRGEIRTNDAGRKIGRIAVGSPARYIALYREIIRGTTTRLSTISSTMSIYCVDTLCRYTL